MAYVTITKDLTEVKDKVAFGLTKRQIVCFSLGGIAGVVTSADRWMQRHIIFVHVIDERMPVSAFGAGMPCCRSFILL